MTTSKRTTRGTGSRPDNGAETPSALPHSAPLPSLSPPAQPPKVRVRVRKSTSGPATAGASSAHLADTTTSAHTLTAEAPLAQVDRYASIAQAAYFRSQHRGFKPGHETEDWLAAEAEVDQRLRISGDTTG